MVRHGAADGADLTGVSLGPLQLPQLPDGGVELVPEPPLVFRDAFDELHGAGVMEELHVGVEHPLPRLQVAKVLVVELVRGCHVEVLLVSYVAGGAVVQEHPDELVGVGLSGKAVGIGGAVSPSDGVRAGERYEVSHVEAAALEGLDELGDVEGGERELTDGAQWGGFQAVEATERYEVGLAPGLRTYMHACR